VKIVIVKGAGKGTEFRLHDGMNALGRDISNRLRLPDPKISRKQCKLRKIGRSLYLYDLGTKNGTYVNNNRVSEAELKIGDEITVGKTVLKVLDGEQAPQAVIEGFDRSSFLKNFYRTIFGHGGARRTDSGEGEFSRFSPRGRKRLWRLPVDTDPPEARHDTVTQHTDPD